MCEPGGMDHLPRLRALRRTDAEAVLSAFASDPEMQRHGTVTDLGEAQSYVERLLGSGATSRAVVIADAADNAVGLIGLDLDDRNLNGWFWYWMHTSHRGRGWTALAAASVANRALDEGARTTRTGPPGEQPRVRPSGSRSRIRPRGPRARQVPRVR